MARRTDDLHAQWHSGRPDAGRDGDRGHAERGPDPVEDRVSRRRDLGRLTGRCRDEQRVDALEDRAEPGAAVAQASVGRVVLGDGHRGPVVEHPTQRFPDHLAKTHVLVRQAAGDLERPDRVLRRRKACKGAREGGVGRSRTALREQLRERVEERLGLGCRCRPLVRPTDRESRDGGLPRRLERTARQRPDHEGGVGDGARDDSDGVERFRDRLDTRRGKRSVTGLVAHDAAECRRPDDRARRLRGERDGHHPCRDRRGRAGRGAAGGPRDIVRIDGGPRWPCCELRGDELPDRKHPMAPRERNAGRVDRRTVPRVDRGSVRRRHVVRVEDVLDADRDPVQRAPGAAAYAVESPGEHEHRLRIHVHPRPHRRVVHVDSLEECPRHRLDRLAAVLERPGELGDGVARRRSWRSAFRHAGSLGTRGKGSPRAGVPPSVVGRAQRPLRDWKPKPSNAQSQAARGLSPAVCGEGVRVAFDVSLDAASCRCHARGGVRPRAGARRRRVHGNAVRQAADDPSGGERGGFRRGCTGAPQVGWDDRAAPASLPGARDRMAHRQAAAGRRDARGAGRAGRLRPLAPCLTRASHDRTGSRGRAPRRP